MHSSAAQSAVVLLALIAACSPLAAVDRVLTHPGGGSTLITVLEEEGLANQGSIASTPTAFEILAPSDSSKYYVVSKTSNDTVLVVDPDMLNVTSRLDLGAAVRAAALTPDDRYLLLSAGSLRVVRTDTDEQVGTGILVGGGAADIVVNNASTTAYVLASGGELVHVIDLASLTISQTLEFNNASAIALSEDNSRLIVVEPAGLRLFRTTDHEFIKDIEAEFEISNASVETIPDSDRVFVVNRASPRGVSQIFDIELNNVETVGAIGDADFEKVLVVGPDRAFGLLEEGQVARVDLTDPPVVTVTEFGENFRDIAASPNGGFLYMASLLDSQLVRADLTSETVTNSVVLSNPPTGLSVVFDPSDLPPATMEILGGNRQFSPPGSTLSTPLSVVIRDREGTPLAGRPVFFRAEATGLDIGIEPAQSVTNRRGVASAIVSFPLDPPPLPSEEQALLPEEEPTASSESVLDEAQLLEVFGPAQEAGDEPTTELIQITANAAEVPFVVFEANIIRSTGLILVGGNFQVMGPNEPFPEPLAVLATDEDGFPLPPGSTVTFSPVFALCDRSGVPVDRNGFAVVQCQALPLPTTTDFVRDGSVTVGVLENPDLGFLIFRFGVSRSANQVAVEKVSGDGQSAEAGTFLPQPLVFRVQSGFGPLGSFGVGVRIRSVSNIPVSITPNFVAALPGAPQEITVRLGPNAGNVRIEAVATSPGFPSATFVATSTGGLPARLETEGNGQTGRVGTVLPNPLRVRVFNESGDQVPFPVVAWELIRGDAQLITGTDADGATAIVQFGDIPGTIVVRATIADLEATFNVTSTPPEPTSISAVDGGGQTLLVGQTSEPLTLVVREEQDAAPNVVVTFSGPPTVTLLPLDDTPPGNPVQQTTGPDGVAGVRVRIDSLATALNPGGAIKSQAPGPLMITGSVSAALRTTFTINALGRTPSATLDGVVNAASFLPGVVPGSLVSIFGSGLSEGFSGTLLPGGATSFRGTSVRVGGIPAPLLSVTNGAQEQINFQVPFEISAGQTTTVQVSNNGSQVVVPGVPVFAAQPGIFEIPLAGGGLAVAAVIHASSGLLVTPENPADLGEAVSLFFTGGGALAPPVGTGNLGPLTPSVMTLPVAVGLDGAGMRLLFQGYAPTFLGLYQVNFFVDEEAACGLRTLTIRVADTLSQETALAVKCP